MSRIRLQFQTDDARVQALCTRYWELTEGGQFVHKVPAIAAEAAMPDHQLIQLVRGSCRASSDMACACGTPYHFFSRADFVRCSRGKDTGWVCGRCSQEAARQRRLEADAFLARKRAMVRRAWPMGEPTDPRTLSLRSAVHLVSFIEHARTETLDVLAPLAERPGPFTGTPGDDLSVVRGLLRQRLIYPDPARLQGFTFADDGSVSLFLDAVSWRLAAPDFADLATAYALELLNLLQTPGAWLSRWIHELPCVWTEVAVRECMIFLESRLAHHGLPPDLVDERASRGLEVVLDIFSIGQTCNVIFQAVARTHEYRMTYPDTTSAHLGNLVLYWIRKITKRYSTRMDALRAFTRPCTATVTRILFYTVLGVGEDGFMMNKSDMQLAAGS